MCRLLLFSSGGGQERSWCINTAALRLIIRRQPHAVQDRARARMRCFQTKHDITGLTAPK